MANVGGRIDDRISAKLLMAAALVDLVAVLFLTKLIGRLGLSVLSAPKGSGGRSMAGMSLLAGVPDVVIYTALFGLVFATYWIVVETVLGGRTIGRTVLGLHMCDEQGARFGNGRRMKRGLRKLSSLGMAGLQVSGPAGYDRNSGCCWHSKMVPRTLGPINTWTLILTTPDGKQKAARLSQIGGFRDRKTVKIGRDPNWADLVLPADSRASAKHCILAVRSGKLHLADNDSSNGTFLGGKKLKPKTWNPLSGHERFEAANIKMRFKQ